MEKKSDNKNNDKLCFILHLISACLFGLSGILRIVSDGFEFSGITNIALGITFGSLSYMYYKKYKEEK